METIPVVAHVEAGAQPEVVANFGIVAAREISRDDVEALATAVLRVVSSVSVFAGRRYEFAAGAAEVVGVEVRVSFPPHTLPEQAGERNATIERVLAEVDAWARAAATAPASEGEDLAARIVRGRTDTSLS